MPSTVIGALKGAGALGLLFGLLCVDELGIATGVGLVLSYTGAAHIQARVFHNIGFPLFYLFSLRLLWCAFSPSRGSIRRQATVIEPCVIVDGGVHVHVGDR
ncbi:DoxX family protein [Phytoactinopolyspora halophila]|uniref:DoxX family protein n=1 Tax=Phytoactinopolyspora halophila TaxID=1981511 RepID=UPI001B8B3F15|nr:DoxX family protein [Phytoactinopolyspora halophila]